MRSSFITGVLAFVCVFSAGADWPNWLGPNQTGATTGGEFPAYWSRSEGVAWSVDLKQPAVSAPIVWQDQVFVATSSKDRKTTSLLAWDRGSGRARWTRQFAESAANQQTPNATVSLQTDGEYLVVSLLNGDLHVFDLTGKELWTKYPAREAKLTASPVPLATQIALQDGKVIVLLPSSQLKTPASSSGKRVSGCHLIAFQIKDGKTAWLQEYSYDRKETDSENFSLVALTDEAEKSLLVAKDDEVINVRAKDGKASWQASAAELLGNGGKTNEVALFGDGLIVAGSRDSDGLAAGKVTAGKFTPLWKQAGSVSLIHPHPLINGMTFWALSKDGTTLQGIDVRSGQCNWSIPMPQGDWTHSPLVAADAKAYGLSQKGEVIVADTANGRMLSRTPMGGESPDAGVVGLALSRGQVFVSAGSRLFCVTGAQLTVPMPKGETGERIGQPENTRRRLPL